MAEIIPLKAWRYHPSLHASIEELLSPLFDVVSPRQREALYQNPNNSIHLSVPRGENPEQDAAQTLARWKAEEIIVQDEKPGIYVYYQYFTLPGQRKESCRKGIIAHIKAYDWEERQILRHENTITHAVEDRLRLLRATKLQASPTHGLYEDPEGILDTYASEAMEHPLLDVEDYQGVREVLGVIRDPEKIAKICRFMRSKKIILADGHHRLESAIAFKNELAADPTASPEEKTAASYHLMYLTNAHTPDLRILPTHRLWTNFLPEELLLEKLSPYFHIRLLHDKTEMEELILQRPFAFGLVTAQHAYKIRLKEALWEYTHPTWPEKVKKLDLSILHYFAFEKALGMPMEEQRTSTHLRYERSLNRCYEAAAKGPEVAFITKEISMQEVLDVCHSGHTLPQKSTFFFPKTISGLLFASLEPDTP
ncbi:MAG: DUF1015 domain-containing protein [Nitritalea sp.]